MEMIGNPSHAPHTDTTLSHITMYSATWEQGGVKNHRKTLTDLLIGIIVLAAVGKQV